jgi:hypothetical protein
MQLFQSVQILQSLKMDLLQLYRLLHQLPLHRLLHQLRPLLHLLLLLHQLRPLSLHRLHLLRLLRLLQVEQLLQCLHSAKASAKELLLAGLRMWAIALQ